MSLLHIAFTGSFIATAVLILPPAASGQTPDSGVAYFPYGQPIDSVDTAISNADSLRQLPGPNTASAGDSASVADSAWADDTTGSRSDSLRPETPATPAGVDTPQAGLDTMRPIGTKDSTKVAARALPSPVDSILSGACGSPDAPPVTIARDLLVVVFTKEAGARERATAARRVKGKLVGQAEPGAYYLRVPAGGGEVGLRHAADQLSLLPQVRQVGSRSCPPRSRDTAS